jgi:hypothetical protein
MAVAANGNGNGHRPFDEDEEDKVHSQPRGFFADQFEVSLGHICSTASIECGMISPAESEQL